MIKPSDPRKLVIDLFPRSICLVQMTAVIADKHGIFSWGWNSVGDGLGEHAEAAAIRRANKKRLHGATIYVAGQRRRNKKSVPGYPCPDCFKLIRARGLHVVYRTSFGTWGVGV